MFRPTNEALGFIEEEDGALRIEDIVIPPPPVATLSHDVPDKRLIITKLKIKNFKSYANEVTLGPFDKNFTAVVGPNGSGKSNVIDSLLFVFGYRAKKIRSKKVSYLIHKSTKYPNVQSCNVTVQFSMISENGDKYTIIPGTDILLSRTAFIDDSSYYEMNKKRVPYKDIARALRNYGIDLEHSRFLILQGEIEAISLMDPKAVNEHDCGMLEYVEDIIGTNRYVEPIKQLTEKLEKLNEEKKEKLNNLKLVEKEKDDLEGPKNKAIEFLRLENKLILSENSVLHCKKFSVEEEMKDIVESKKQILDKLNQVKAEINGIKNSRKGQEEELEKITSELDIHIKEFEKCKDAYKTLERKDVAMAEEIKHIKAKKSKMESSLTSTKNDLVKLKKQLETYENETSELTKMKEKLDAEKMVEDKKMSQVMSSAKCETDKLQEKKDKFESELLELKKQVYNLKSEMELLQSELNILTRTDKKEKQALANMKSSREASLKGSRDEKTLLDKEEQQIVTLQQEVQTLMEQIAQSQHEEVALSEELKNTRVKFEEAKSSLSAYKSQSGLMQAFSKEKACGRLSGVYGRLGDLGAIDEKYDVAISTACGQLDNIVTDTLSTAQKCVEFLKRNNLGYATFIPLEKMTQWIPYTHRRISTPENVPRLFDLVHVKDDAVLPAFYFALRDTLVSNNLDQATRIGLQGSARYRVVTLKGELIDLAGTMSGGGGRVARGRMGQTVVECTHTPEDVAEINQQLDNITRSVTEMRRSILNFQEQYSRKTKELSSLKLSVKKRRSNYQAFLDSVEMLETQIKEQEKKVANSSVDEKKVHELKEKIMKKEKRYAVANKESSDVEETVSKYQDEILKITKGSMGKAKKVVDQLTKKIAEVSQSLTKSIVNTKTCKRNIKKAEEKIKNGEKEVEDASHAKTILDSDRESSVSKARDFLEKQEQAQAAVEKLKESKVKLKKALETFHEKEHQLKLAEIKQKNELKQQEDVESEKRAVIRSCKARMDKLKLNEVESDSTEIPILSVEEIHKLNVKRLNADMELLRVQLEEIKPDLASIKEYKKKEALCSEKQKEFDDVVNERNMQSMRCEELRKRRLTEFMRGFTAIAKKLKEIYQMLTLGGDAEMELVDTFDPFSKGIEFSVRPPRKSWKYMRNLSGGEKTLSSLALVFALHYYRPTPFYVMDEIDAALDVRNVAIVGFYLRKRTRNTQFIIVSLRNIMNELSDHLIGIFKTNNCSRNISIKNVHKWKEESEEDNEIVEC